MKPNASRIIHHSLIPALSLLVLVAGCTLPLCDDGDSICIYQIHDTKECLDQCYPQSALVCPESCYCSDSDLDCVEFVSTNTRKSCILHVCENDNWQRGIECSRGFADGTCRPVCFLNEVQGSCLTDPTNACSYQFCDYNSDSLTFVWSNSITCPNGFDISRSQCAELCQLGEIQCPKESDNSVACLLQRCEPGPSGNRWSDPRTCRFGFDARTQDCVNPCNICSDEVNTACPRTVYDNNSAKMYVCDEYGWHLDNSCTNDFVPDPEQPPIDPLKVIKHLPEITSIDPPVFGHCGECSDETSPIFCDSDRSVMHYCENGKYTRINIDKDNNACTDFTLCRDDYSYILVDTQTNRNHCGECNNKCSNMQKCEKGQCQSTVQCENGEITQVQLGSRWVKAYCIGKEETLVAVGDMLTQKADHKENGDAYICDAEVFEDCEFDAIVFIDDIAVTQPWNPAKSTDLIVLGNKKTITFNGGFADDNSNIGFFSTLKSSYIDDLTIVYPNSDLIYDDAEHFGLLAGVAIDSHIRNVSVDIPNVIKTENIVAAGGLIGIAEGDISIDGLKLHVQLEANNHETSLTQDTGIGGIIGIANDITEILNISEQDQNHASISLTGQANVGGLIGLYSISDNNHKAAIEHIDLNQIHLSLYNMDNDDSDASYTNRHFGGIIGKTKFPNTNEHILLISDILLDKVMIDESVKYNCSRCLPSSMWLGGIAGHLSNTDLTNISIGDFSIHNNHSWTIGLGGIAGNAENITADTLEIQNLSMDADYSATYIVDEKRMYDVGGLFGNATDVMLNHVTIGSIEENSESSIKLKSFYHNIGGLVGNGSRIQIQDAEVNTNVESKDNGYQIGGVLGIGNDITIQNLKLKSQIKGWKNVGGLAGSADGLSISNTSITSEITGYMEKLGGIAGAASKVDVRSSSVNTNISGYDMETAVSGSSEAGGLFGTCETSTIQDVELNGRIGSASFYVGSAIGIAIKSLFISNVTSQMQIALPEILYSIAGFIGSCEECSLTISDVLSETRIEVPRHSALLGYFGGFIQTLSAAGSMQNINSFVYIMSNDDDITDSTYEYYDFNKNAFVGTVYSNTAMNLKGILSALFLNGTSGSCTSSIIHRSEDTINSANWTLVNDSHRYRCCCEDTSNKETICDVSDEVVEDFDESIKCSCEALYYPMTCQWDSCGSVPDIPISISKTNDAVTCTNNQTACLQNNMPLCLDGNAPVCSGKSSTCSDDSAAQCYKFMKPSFCE